MADFFFEYGLFLLKAVTIVVSIVVVIIAIVASASRDKKPSSGSIQLKKINDELDEYKEIVREAVLDEHFIKLEHKRDKAKKKAEQKAHKKALKKMVDIDSEPDDRKKQVFVIDFDGDIRASAVKNMRREITALLTMATKQDEVILRLESGGGMVHSYGLAASQLMRITDKEIPLTICVDKVAASGGYMMACIADKIIAAPFAILGSIGVVAQIPNVHRLLKKNDIDVEVLTAGEYKRTLTLLGENTEKGREKFIEDLDDTHALFKTFVSEHRPELDLDEVATGEHWFGRRAIEKKLVDILQSSDEYITQACENADVYSVKYVVPEPLAKKLGLSLPHALENTAVRLWDRFQQTRFHR